MQYSCKLLYKVMIDKETMLLCAHQASAKTGQMFTLEINRFILETMSPGICKTIALSIFYGDKKSSICIFCHC